MKYCKKCNSTKPLTEFYKNQYNCKDCQRILWRERRQKYKADYDGKNKHRKQEKLDKVSDIKYKSGCKYCKEKDPRCLDFHHTKDNKIHNVAYLVSSGYRWQSVLDEIAKCEIICSNCHRKHHQKLPSHFEGHL